MDAAMIRLELTLSRKRKRGIREKPMQGGAPSQLYTWPSNHRHPKASSQLFPNAIDPEPWKSFWMTYSWQAPHPTTYSPIQGQLTNTARISSTYFSWREFTFLRNWVVNSLWGGLPSISMLRIFCRSPAFLPWKGASPGFQADSGLALIYLFIFYKKNFRGLPWWSSS